MAQLITPNSVKVVTQNGEVTISLQIDLNINLNQSGTVVGADSTVNSILPNKTKKMDDDAVDWEIPDFGPTKKINFGK